MIHYQFLRHASPEEMQDILALYREAGWISKDECGAFLPAVLSGSFLFLAARIDGKIIGMARAISDGVSDAYIQDVVVSAAYRKLGIGKELIFRLRDELKTCGVDWIGLVGAPGTENFYSRLGLKEQPGYTLWKLENDR